MRSVKILSFMIFMCSGKSWAITSKEILSYAETASGSYYVLGDSRWNPEKKKWTSQGRKVGVDCAGLVLKSWQWGGKRAYTEKLPYDEKTMYRKLHTSEMKSASVTIRNSKGKKVTQALPWSKTKLSSLKEANAGDMMVSYNGGKVGHTFLVKEIKAGSIQTVEARGASYGVGFFKRTLSSAQSSKYMAYRHPEKKKSALTSKESQAILLGKTGLADLYI